MPRTYEPDEDCFLRNVSKHRMEIVQDNDLYRHLVFANPESSSYRFNLVTWPGYLAIAGDCSDFMFTRTRDMFEFFRGDGINPGYWGEKAVAVARHRGTEEFDDDAFREAVVRDFLAQRHEMPQGRRLAIWKEIREELLETHFDDQGQAIRAAMDADYEVIVPGPYRDHRRTISLFPDFWDHNLTKPSWGFVWACRAILWGIARYDEAKNQPASDAA